jgi:hypothetical protein
MIDNTVAPISNLKPEVSPDAQLAQNNAAASPALRQSQPVSASKSAPGSQPSATPLTHMAEISLRYKVDTKTNDLTVFVIDRASRRVLRTIPPEEINQLKVGDLIQLLV